MKKFLMIVAMIIPWVVVGVLLAFPVVSIKFYNTVSGREAYEFTYNEPRDRVEYAAADCVTKNGDPDLTDLEVEKEHEVTDEDVTAEMDDELANYSDTTELETGMTVESGMNLTIAYDVEVDGAEVDGLGSDELDIALGSDVIMEGLDAEIEGHEVGETFDVSIEIPESFNEDLAGKTANFTITINSGYATTTVTADTVTDEFIANNFEDYETVEEYREGMQEDVEEYYKLLFENNKKSAVLEAIKDSCDVEVPDDLLEQETEIYAAQFTNMYCNGEELEDYLENYYATTLDEFYDTIADDVKTSVENVLVCQYYADELGVKLTDEDLTKYLDELTSGTSYSSENADEVYALYKTEYMTGKEYVERMALCDKVVETMAEDATFVYVDEVSEDTSEGTSEDASEE